MTQPPPSRAHAGLLPTPTARVERLATAAILAVGLVLRVHLYLVNPSLWFDEAAVTASILSRDFGDLLGKLDHAQVAPAGYLLLSKLLVVWFGDSEYVLRLPSFLAGIAALFLFAGLGRRLLPPVAALGALLLFSFSGQAIFYTSQVKPYGIDLAFAMLLTLLAVDLRCRADAGPVGAPRLWAFALAGAVAPWFSLPSTFVLAGVGVVLLIGAWRRGQGRLVAGLIAAGAAWLASFGGLYLLSVRHSLGDSLLTAFWGGSEEPGSPLGGAFLPWVGPWSDTLSWLGHAFMGLFENVARLRLAWLAAIVFVAGCGTALVRSRAALALLLAPVLIAMVASAFDLYPFFGRLMLFGLPAVLLLVVAGLARLAEVRDGRLAWLALILFGAIAAGPMLQGGRHLLRGPSRPEVRPALRYYQAHREDGDQLYLYYGADLQARYYERRIGLAEGSLVHGICARKNPSRYRADLDQLDGPRAWILFAHALPPEEQLLLETLAARGERLEHHEFGTADLYLYRLHSR